MTNAEPMRGREFVKFADQTTGLTGQAATRSRISRYYYGAYLEYREHFASTGHMARERLAREHQVIKRRMAEHFPDVAAMMETLRTSRNLADYELDVELDTLQLLDVESRASAFALLEKIGAMPE